MPSRRRLTLLLVAWIAWPLAVAAVNLWLAPGAQCAADDCGAGTSSWRAALWIAVAVLPGTLVLAWRRRESRPRGGRTSTSERRGR